MSIWSNSSLSGADGELFSVRVSVEPRALEDLLETLALVPFPINPQIYHPGGNGTHHCSVVEFPAYSAQLAQVRSALSLAGFEPGVVEVRSMLDRIGYRHAAVA